jgi:hypothetical protein
VSWRTEWTAISGRITSLLDAGHICADLLKIYKSDYYGGVPLLMNSAAETFHALEVFDSTYSHTLPERAAQRLREFIKTCGPKFGSAPQGKDADFQILQFRLTALRAAQSELTYLLADTEVTARKLVDRAFLHLQRAIVADEVVREAWCAAFKKGETACEMLGATHLLLHGIWAFKAYSQGERTDLVFGEKLTLTLQIEGAAEALVLTEWKLVRHPADLAEQAENAFTQAKLYGRGSLAGFEVQTRRYLVMVSEKPLQMPADRDDSEVVYPYVNIAVNPTVPSRRSRT